MKIKKLLFVFLTIFQFSAFATTHHILFLGDSLTEGLGVDEEQSYPRLVEKKLREKKFDVAVTNGGVSGATSASGLRRLKWHLKKKTDVLVLELGANDGLRGLKLSVTEKNLSEIIAYAKNQKIKVLLLGVLMPPNYGKKYVSDFEGMYKKIAATQRVPFFPFLLKGVAGNAEFNQADGIHPNIKGHEMVAKNVAEFVEKNL